MAACGVGKWGGNRVSSMPTGSIHSSPVGEDL